MTTIQHEKQCLLRRQNVTCDMCGKHIHNNPACTGYDDTDNHADVWVVDDNRWVTLTTSFCSHKCAEMSTKCEDVGELELDIRQGEFTTTYMWAAEGLATMTDMLAEISKTGYHPMRYDNGPGTYFGNEPVYFIYDGYSHIEWTTGLDM